MLGSQFVLNGALNAPHYTSSRTDPCMITFIHPVNPLMYKLSKASSSSNTAKLSYTTSPQSALTWTIRISEVGTAVWHLYTAPHGDLASYHPRPSHTWSTTGIALCAGGPFSCHRLVALTDLLVELADLVNENGVWNLCFGGGRGGGSTARAIVC